MRQALVTIGPLLMSALAFSQAGQPTTASQPTAPQPSSQQSTTQQPAKAPPAKPRSVADAARASKQAHESAPPQKVYRNKDLADSTGPDNAQSSSAGTTATPPAKSTPSQPAPRPAKTADEIVMEKEKSFEAQGNVFKRQILVQKGKIIDIQNQSQNLYAQLNAWSVEHHYDANPAMCWTSEYNNPYFKDWCAIGRGLQAAYDASERQLAQEKARLEQMQEDMRRKGYGNAIYDAD